MIRKISMHFMELAEIRAFVAVAESGSIKQAARRLARSQPAVTRQIQRLEASLGVELFDRRTKPLALTAPGREALERCRAVLRAVEELRGATAPGRVPAGELRLGVAHALADVTLVGPVDRVRRAFPQVSLRLVAGWSRELLERVRSGALDAAVVQLPEGGRPPAGVEGEPIGAERLAVVAARGVQRPGGDVLADLGGAAWVLNPEGCGFRAALQRALLAVGAPLHVSVEAWGFDLQLSLVARGAGLGLVPVRVLARHRLRSRLRRLRVRGLDFKLAVWIVRGQVAASLAPVLACLDRALRRRLA
ncbi:MAG TPA: LysR family transcriptional regulator [Thermodesulfobacteriota bacterium]|nr:LysR family transcriptional regulator [Thermodesulfobacteriota bacterium]